VVTDASHTGTVEMESELSVFLQTPARRRLELRVKGQGLSLTVGNSWYAPEFGKREKRLNIKIKGRCPCGETRLGFVLRRVDVAGGSL